MAERRMFSKAIISSGKFLRMPPTSRLLYYDLGMAADDDGVVEAYSVMTQTKATEDDLRVLVSKGYVRLLNEDLVSLITDWKINNAIRSDRYRPSIYAELITSTFDNQLATISLPNDNRLDTEDRIDKDSRGKDRTGKGSDIEPHGSKPTRRKYGKYQKVLLSDAELTRLIDDFGQSLTNEYIRRLDKYIDKNKANIADHNFTIRKWIREDIPKSDDGSNDSKSQKEYDELEDYLKKGAK